MTTFHETSPLLPKGEGLRKAIRYAEENDLEWNLETVDTVSQQYDLSPLESDFLVKQFIHRQGIGG